MPPDDDLSDFNLNLDLEAARKNTVKIDPMPLEIAPYDDSKPKVPIQMHEVDLGKFNNRIRDLEKMRRETLAELNDMEDSMDYDMTHLDTDELRAQGVVRVDMPKGPLDQLNP